jgi:hypothetical protein
VKRSWSWLALAVVALVSPSEAAENFACGEGGVPDAKTAKCVCPKGKIESTSNGTSRCIDAPKPKPAPPKPPLPPLPKCPPSQIPTPTGCVDRCAPQETWTGAGCVATPTPSSSEPVCTGGKVLDPTGKGCCYEGQIYTTTCRGKPTCPADLVVDGETCVAKCDEGMEPVADRLHCCWPEQDWSNAVSKCVGVPACAAGYHSNDASDGCVRDASVAVEPAPAMESAPPAGDESEGRRFFAADESDETMGPFRFELGLGGGYLRASGVDVGFISYTMGVHLRDVPILFRAEVFGASGISYGCREPDGTACQGKVATVLGGVAFAPFSVPAMGSGKFSTLNPFLGVDVAYYQWRTTASSSQPAPAESGGSFLATAGNTFFFATKSAPAIGLTLLGSRAFAGAASRTDLRLSVNVSVALF